VVFRERLAKTEGSIHHFLVKLLCLLPVTAAVETVGAPSKLNARREDHSELAAAPRSIRLLAGTTLLP